MSAVPSPVPPPPATDILESLQPWASPAVAVVAAVIAFFAYLNARRSRIASEKSATTADSGLKLARDQFEDAKIAREQEKFENLSKEVLSLVDQIIPVCTRFEGLLVTWERLETKEPPPKQIIDSLLDACTNYSGRYLYVRPFLKNSGFAEELDDFNDAIQQAMISVGLSGFKRGDAEVASLERLSETVPRLRTTERALSKKIRAWLSQ